MPAHPLFRRCAAALIVAVGLPVLALPVLSLPAAAQAPDYTAGTVYDAARGWTVLQSTDYGCSAYPEAMPLVLNTPPAGGWQLILPYTVSAPEGEFAGAIDVDKASFTETYYGDGQWIYASFPLEMRKAVGAGDRLQARIGPMEWDVLLTGTTAAMLMLEECWQDLSGWSSATSSRAGTFAFSGD